MTQYMLTVFIVEEVSDPGFGREIVFYMTATSPDGYVTGLMYCNLLSEYLPENVDIKENSTDYMILPSWYFYKMIHLIQKDWDKWSKWLDTDRDEK